MEFLASITPQEIIDPYAGYSYAYPHKTAYRPFEQPISLQEIWANERQSSLFLYLHVPFCTGRCSYCNLFSVTNPEPGLIRAYMDAIERQADTIMDCLPSAHFARFAIGGGTPTFLSPATLERLFGIVRRTFRCDLTLIPSSVEISPESASQEKLEMLREAGVERISLGVQTFLDKESQALGRRQSYSMIERVIKDIRDIGFPILNMDLIYGGPLQTVESWRSSLETALRYGPEELYLYPLYVRQHTPLFQSFCPDQDRRLELYRIGRDTIMEGDYIQESMRMFCRRSVYKEQGPAYCCQEDGMIGIGCGARSYTRQMHYSSEYAAHPEQISQIIDRFTQQTDFHRIHYGILLNPDEQKRRFIIKSLLRCKGLDRNAYRVQFHSDPVEDYSILKDLEQQGLVMIGSQTVYLTQRGLEVSDAIGPALYSLAIRERMESFVWR